VDDPSAPSATESWTLSLRHSERFFTFNTSGRAVDGRRAVAVRHSLSLRALSIYGLFERGVVQMMAAEAAYSAFPSLSPLPRVYALGGGSAIDVRRSCAAGAVACGTTLFSSVAGPGASGIHEVVCGSAPSPLDAWGNGSIAQDARACDGSTEWCDSRQTAPEWP
jgi:hypothetical protein